MTPSTALFTSLENLKQVTESNFFDALGALPPKDSTGNSFLLGEPASDRVCNVTSRYSPTWHGYIHTGDGIFLETVQPVTRAEFAELRNETLQANSKEIPCIKDPYNTKSVFFYLDPEDAAIARDSLAISAKYHAFEAGIIPVRRPGLADKAKDIADVSHRFATMEDYSYSFVSGVFSPKECDAAVDGLISSAAIASQPSDHAHSSRLALKILEAQTKYLVADPALREEYIAQRISLEQNEISAHAAIFPQAYTMTPKPNLTKELNRAKAQTDNATKAFQQIIADQFPVAPPLPPSQQVDTPLPGAYPTHQHAVAGHDRQW
jgi:hypothetical protein